MKRSETPGGYVVRVLVRALGLLAPLLVVTGSSAGAPALTYPFVSGVVPDARALAMGETHTAVAEGAYAVWWNPGALGLARGWDASPLSSWRHYYGPGWTRSFGLSAKRGRVGIGGVLTYVDSELGRQREGDEATEDMVVLGAGFDLLEALRHEPDPLLQLGVGAAFRRVHAHSVTTGFAGGRQEHNDASWDADLGFLGRMERTIGSVPPLGLGLSSGPARPSYVAVRVGSTLRNALDREFRENPMGRVVKAGVSLEGGFVGIPPLGHLVRLLAAVDVDDPLGSHAASIVKLGVEATAFGILSARYGKIEDEEKPTRGLGVRLGTERASVSFDYARLYISQYTVSVHYTP